MTDVAASRTGRTDARTPSPRAPDADAERAPRPRAPRAAGAARTGTGQSRGAQLANFLERTWGVDTLKRVD